MTIDIKNFYLNIEMTNYEYIRMHISIFPQHIIDHYNLNNIATKDGFVYMEIRKGMYGLPQAGKLAHDKLKKLLISRDYHPAPHTPGLWTHKRKDIYFSLVVDDFGVKYTKESDVQELIQLLSTTYTVTTDFTGVKYCGLTLLWDYTNRTVQLSMPGYIKVALLRFQHETPTRPEHAPYKYVNSTYSTQPPELILEDTSTPLIKSQITRIQQIVGTLLYYTRAVDTILLTTLNDIATQQSKGTIETSKSITKLLNFCATYPNASIIFCASDMVLHVDSDASYLSLSKARSRAGGHYYLSDLSSDPTKEPTNVPKPNGPVYTVCHILRHIMASAAEAEIAALFKNGQEAVVLRNTLRNLGHPQPPTPIKTDNSTAAGIANNTILQRKSRAMDMIFYWVRDRVNQGQFIIYWRPGVTNLGDYFTKHHPPSHHIKVRHHYVTDIAPTLSSLQILYNIRRGCVNITKPSSAYNVLAMVNTILSKNIKFYTDNKDPNTK